MGKLKDLLYTKMQEAGLSEKQEDKVMELLADSIPDSFNSLAHQIDWAIDQVKNQSPSVAELRQTIHDNNNKYQVKLVELELQNFKLKQALHAVINFEWNAWTEAKKLLNKLDESQDKKL